MDRDFGKVEFKGKTYTLLCDAWVDNKGTNGHVMYYAKAIDENGNKFKVEWQTTDNYDKAGELLNLENRLKDLERNRYTQESEEIEKKEIKERIEELEKDGIYSSFAEDESNACEWDYPANVFKYEEF